MNDPTVYPGKDLEAMSFSVNYHTWILEEFRPFIGNNVVEVGAGTGSFSEMLLSAGPKTLSLIEPSEMFENLERNIARSNPAADVDFYNSIFLDVADRLIAKGKPDTIVYVNVLEHIEDDIKELHGIYDCLAKGGHALIFVPALMALYGKFDRRIGHFRRYSKQELEEKCRSAGFSIVKSKYFDFAGIIPWFVKYRLLGSDILGSGAVTVYDKMVVPLMKRFEGVVKVPLGKNILIVVRKD